MNEETVPTFYVNGNMAPNIKNKYAKEMFPNYSVNRSEVSLLYSGGKMKILKTITHFWMGIN